MRVTTKIAYSDVPFPDVYVCPMQRATLHEIERIAAKMSKENLTDFRMSQVRTGNTNLDNYLTLIGRYKLLERTYKDNDEMRRQLTDLFLTNRDFVEVFRLNN